MTVSPSDTRPADTRADPNDDPSNPFGGYRLDGTYWAGPAGIRCALAVLIEMSVLLRVSGSTPEGERTKRVRTRAAELRAKYSLDELQAMEVARRQVRTQTRSGHPFYARPMKPANSGRKRRAA